MNLEKFSDMPPAEQPKESEVALEFSDNAQEEWIKAENIQSMIRNVDQYVI